MKKTLYILLIFPFILFGQTWEQIYGGDGTYWGYSVQQTNDEGFIVTGVGDRNVYLLKTDIDGNGQWSINYGDNFFNNGTCVKQTIDGGFIVVGYTSASNFADHYDVYLIKTYANGTLQWSNTFSFTDVEEYDDKGLSVQQTTDEGYVILGYTENGVEDQDSDVYVIKVNENGVEQWSNTYGGSDLDVGQSIEQTSDNGYVIFGTTESYGYGHEDFYLIKIDANGDLEWEQTYGGTDDEFAYSGQQTTDGGYIICGATESYGNGYGDVYIIKTNENGVQQWAKTFGDSGHDVGTFVQQTNDGGYIICGAYEQVYGDGEHDFYLIKIDASGYEEWTRTYGTETDELALCLDQTSDGGYIIVGFTENGSGNNDEGDIYLIKTDSEGNLSTSEVLDLTINKTLIKTIDLLGRKTKNKSFTPLIDLYDDGSAQKRLIIE